MRTPKGRRPSWDRVPTPGRSRQPGPGRHSRPTRRPRRPAPSPGSRRGSASAHSRLGRGSRSWRRLAAPSRFLERARHERRRRGLPFRDFSAAPEAHRSLPFRGGAAPPMANRFREPDRVLETTMPCGFLDRAGVSSVPSPAHHRLPGSRHRTPTRGIPGRRTGEMRRRGTIGSRARTPTRFRRPSKWSKPDA